MLTIILSTYKISFCGKRRGIAEIRGEIRIGDVSKQELTSGGKSNSEFTQSSIKFNTLDTIVNKLVHDSAESEFEEEN